MCVRVRGCVFVFYPFLELVSSIIVLLLALKRNKLLLLLLFQRRTGYVEESW